LEENPIGSLPSLAPYKHENTEIQYYCTENLSGIRFFVDRGEKTDENKKHLLFKGVLI
jgi:hypothetical protein